MSTPLPTTIVQRVPNHWREQNEDYTLWPWGEINPLPPFILANNSAPATFQTTVRLAYDAENFYVRYDCDDPDIWGKAVERDSAIYDEEVVELFIAPGEDHPTYYYEFEVSPLGTMLDLTVNSPNLERRGIKTDFAWDCPGLQWKVERNDAKNHWRAYMVLPWQSIGAPSNALPEKWRANFYRIERPRGQAPEFSCWSPTMSDPADYHRPVYFGYMMLATT